MSDQERDAAIKNGIHQYPEGVWHGMSCTKDRYESKDRSKP